MSHSTTPLAGMADRRIPDALTRRCRIRKWETLDLLPNFAKSVISLSMSTMNISLPDTLKSFVDQQVNVRGYGTSSEYVRELIRKDQDIQRLREILLDGAGSATTSPVDAGYFRDLRDRVTQITRS
jgi:antitoxin ParD1/3/4